MNSSTYIHPHTSAGDRIEADGTWLTVRSGQAQTFRVDVTDLELARQLAGAAAQILATWRDTVGSPITRSDVAQAVEVCTGCGGESRPFVFVAGDRLCAGCATTEAVAS